VSTVVVSSEWAQTSDDSSSMVEAASSAVRIFEYLFIGSQVRILFTRTATAVTWFAAAHILNIAQYHVE